MAELSPVIDDFSEAAPRASNGAVWEFIADGVMGGLSSGTMARETVAGRNALRLRGTVSLANNGGFIQIALDLAPGGSVVDASGFAGVEIDAIGNGESYNVHLRTVDVTRPWQSYRRSFVAGPTWATHRLPFADFAPHRIDVPLTLTKLRRIGILAIGRSFDADIAIGGVRFYR